MAKGYKAVALPKATHALLVLIAKEDHLSMSQAAVGAIEERALDMMNRGPAAVRERMASLLLEPLAASVARDGWGIKRLEDGTYQIDFQEPTGPFGDELDEEGIRQ